MMDKKWYEGSLTDLGSPPQEGLLIQPSYRFYLDMGEPTELVQEQLKFVEKHNWLDEASRLMTISFFVFNPSLACIILVQIQFRLSLGGLVTFETNSQTLRVRGVLGIVQVRTWPLTRLSFC